MSDKIHSQEGNSPDCWLRSQKKFLVIKEVKIVISIENRLRSSHSLKKA